MTGAARVLRRTLPRLALALALGTGGGWLATRAGVPLPWLLGSMSAATLAALAGAPLAAWGPLRAIYMMVLGVLLGSGFSPSMAAGIGAWGVSLSVLVLYSLGAGLVGTLFFRFAARMRGATSFFAAMPGGLSEMVMLGQHMGGDVRSISLAHAVRLLLVVLVLPLAVAAGGDTPEQARAAGPGFAAVTPDALAVLTGCALGGWWLARLARCPAAPLIGPAVLSAALHLGGVLQAGPPAGIVAAAQVAVGSAIGACFAGTRIATVARLAVCGAGGTALLFAGLAAFVALGHALTGMPPAVLAIAYAPGGLAEMTLVAFSLDAQPAFVATHHIVRLVLIVLVAPTGYRLARWTMARRRAAAGR